MARYQGLDWREGSKWGCNAMIDPTLEGRYDGSSLQPYEVPVAWLGLLTHKFLCLDGMCGSCRLVQYMVLSGCSPVRSLAWVCRACVHDDAPVLR